MKTVMAVTLGGQCARTGSVTDPGESEKEHTQSAHKLLLGTPYTHAGFGRSLVERVVAFWLGPQKTLSSVVDVEAILCFVCV